MTPCRFFNGRGGCRQGRNCKFSHDTRSGTVSPALSSSSNSNPTRIREVNAPPGVCKFFWSSGKCRLEFGCRFRHTSSTESRLPGQRAMAVPTQPVATLAPFLNEGGLARITGRGTDIFFSNPDKSMTPNEAHNHLRRFLFDQFRFAKTFDVYAFVTPLNSAHTSNNSWVGIAERCLLESSDFLLDSGRWTGWLTFVGYSCLSNKLLALPQYRSNGE